MTAMRDFDVEAVKENQHSKIEHTAVTTDTARIDVVRKAELNLSGDQYYRAVE